MTHLYLWCAGVGHTDIPPALQVELLTTPLRSAPAVLRAVKPAVDLWSGLGKVHGYSDSGLAAPGDGPSVVELSHHGDGKDFTRVVAVRVLAKSFRPYRCQELVDNWIPHFFRVASFLTCDLLHTCNAWEALSIYIGT